MAERKRPNAALRRLAESITEDICRAPIQSPNSKDLRQALHNFVAVEHTMTSTSETLRKTESNLACLKRDADQWESSKPAAAMLRKRLDECFDILNLPPEESGAQTKSPSKATESKGS
eukprot:IDg18635t1